MKKFLFFIFGSTFAIAQNYQPLVNTNHVWKFSFIPSAYCNPNQPLESVNYKTSLGNDIEIDGITYKEVKKQFEFENLAQFQEVKNCDNNQEDHFFLSFLNDSNYNSQISAGYIREDIAERKVFIKPLNGTEKLLYNFEHDFSVNPINLSLIEVTTADVYNQTTSNYKFGLPYGNGYYNILESIGDESDLITSTKINIDGTKINLEAFSTDNGSTFYQRNNDVLELTDIITDKNYKIVQNPVANNLILTNYSNIDQIQIVDSSGKIILTKKDKFNAISTQHLIKGTYYLIISSDKKISKIQFLKK